MDLSYNNRTKKWYHLGYALEFLITIPGLLILL